MNTRQVFWLLVGVDVVILLTLFQSLAARIPWLDEHTGWKRYLRLRKAIDKDRYMSTGQFVFILVLFVAVAAELSWAYAQVL